MQTSHVKSILIQIGLLGIKTLLHKLSHLISNVYTNQELKNNANICNNLKFDLRVRRQCLFN